jgi:hypothetical protein
VLTRRSFLQSTLLLSAGAARGFRALAQLPTSSLHVLPNAPVASVPDNFIGLGYEMSSVAQPNLFSDQNAKYVQLVRNLGIQGVVRLGGIVSDYTRYVPNGPSRNEPKDTVISRADLGRLRGFLEATGWTAIWSVNFGSGTLDDAIAEASAVQQVLGAKLAAVELGNEVENYGRGASPIRTPPYDFSSYLAEYRTWHRALLAAIPRLRFAAPDTASSVEWVGEMAADAPGDVQLLTTHYYRGDQRKGTLEQLAHPDPQLAAKLDRLRQASHSSGIPWRMCETNSFFGGGRPGLSDTFAGALWTLNYLLLLAQSGCAGVNIETGYNQLGFMSSYSPIRADFAGSIDVGPSYYGMLAFAAAGVAGASMLPIKLDGPDPDPAVYAIGQPSRVQALVIINWNESSPRSVSLAGLGLDARDAPSMRVLRLTAPSLLSQSQVRLGDAAVDASGHWQPVSRERVRAGMVVVAPASAVILSQREFHLP